MNKIKLAVVAFFTTFALFSTAAIAASEYIPNIAVSSAYVEQNLNTSVVEMGITTGFGENGFMEFTVDTEGSAAAGYGNVQQISKRIAVVGYVEYKTNRELDTTQTTIEGTGLYQPFKSFGVYGGAAYKFIKHDTFKMTDEIDYKLGAIYKLKSVKFEYNYTHTQAVDADLIQFTGASVNEHEVVVKFDAKQFTPYVKAIHTVDASAFEAQKTQFVLGIAAGF